MLCTAGGRQLGLCYTAREATYLGIRGNTIFLSKGIFGVHAEENGGMIRCSQAGGAVKCVWGGMAPLGIQQTFTRSRKEDLTHVAHQFVRIHDIATCSG